MFPEEDDKKYGEKIINALDVPACWVSYCPNIQHSFKTALNSLVEKQRNVGFCAWDINKYLLQHSLFLDGAITVRDVKITGRANISGMGANEYTHR